ncbi:MAG: FkbM family methyltransferase [Gammaproteobacteria bacterium]|nr:FkbM family methyltransferase [Gammaproteobacteria bacterium]MCY4274251.1 FkbM family methyltransferase [Gammaproteobacteria bacterium]
MSSEHNVTERLRSRQLNTRQPGEWKDHARCALGSSYSKLWHRSYRPTQTDTGRVAVEHVEVEVVANEFWHWYSADWERRTEQIYRQFVKPGGLVLDIGAWIGPTIIYALVCKASRVVALEPNPNSFAALVKIADSIPENRCQLELLNIAIDDNEGTVSMGLPEGSVDTSRSGWEGHEFVVPTITLEKLIRSQNIRNPDLVKIDIEGGEANLGEGLSMMAPYLPVVHLSVHVPFFPPESQIDEFIRATSEYKLFDDRGRFLKHSEFSDRITSNEKFPAWGGRKGNFFQVLMLSKKA